MNYEDFLKNINLSQEEQEVHWMDWSFFDDVPSLLMYQKYLLYEKNLKIKERVKLLKIKQ